MPPTNHSSVTLKLAFWSFLLGLVVHTWAFALHIPVPVTDGGVDKPGGRFSFGKPFHLIWDLDEPMSGKVTFIAEPMVGPNNLTLIEDVDIKDLEAYASITPPRPWPESDTYFIHAVNSSNPKQVLSSTSNIWIFDDQPETATLVVISGTATTSTSTTTQTQTTTPSSNNSTTTGNSRTPPTPSVSDSTSSPTLTPISTMRSTSTSTTPPPSTSVTLTHNTMITTPPTTTTSVNVPPTTTQSTGISNLLMRRNAIIGGIIGGVALILLLMIALLLSRRRREHKIDQFAAFPVDIIPSAHTPPQSKSGEVPITSLRTSMGMAQAPIGRQKSQPHMPQWPPEGTEVPRHRRKFQPGLGAPIPPVPETPQVDGPNTENNPSSEEDAQRLRSQADAMNERIAELESQLVRGLDIGRQPPGYVSQRQSVIPP